MSQKERARIAREKLGLSQAELAEKAGVSQSTIANLEVKSDDYSPRGLKKIAAALGIAPEELRFGVTSEPSSIIPAQQHVAILEDSRDPTSTHIQIPRYDVKLSAGGGNAVWIVRESEDDPIFFRKGWFRARHLNPDSLRGMYIRGDSMEPYLQNYDTVIIDTDDTEIADGEVYAIVYKNNFYVKELRKFENGIRIISHNPAYEPMECCHNDPPDSFQNLGRVVWRGG